MTHDIVTAYNVAGATRNKHFDLRVSALCVLSAHVFSSNGGRAYDFILHDNLSHRMYVYSIYRRTCLNNKYYTYIYLYKALEGIPRRKSRHPTTCRRKAVQWERKGVVSCEVPQLGYFLDFSSGRVLVPCS